MSTKGHLEATVCEGAMFLTQGAALTAKMKAAIVARLLFQHVFIPQPGTIEAGVQATTPRDYCN